MADIWILTANGSQATIFEAQSPTSPLVEVATLENPEARAKQMDLASDRPGRTFDSVGGQRHAKAAPTEPKTKEQIRFAKAVAARLEQGRVDNAFGRLVLVAAPAFLGLLRPNFGAPLAARVSLEVDKDYTALKADELRARLPARL